MCTGSTMKLFLLILSSILLSGCVASSYVSSIGAQSIHGDTKVNSSKAVLHYADRSADPLGVIEGKPLPFTNLYISNESDKTTSVSFSYEDIIWDEIGSTDGKIDLLINDEIETFSVYKYQDTIELEYDFRNWYGYPAQSLLLVTIPADVIITTVALPVIGLGLLFIALTMEPPLH